MNKTNRIMAYIAYMTFRVFQIARVASAAVAMRALLFATSMCMAGSLAAQDTPGTPALPPPGRHKHKAALKAAAEQQSQQNPAAGFHRVRFPMGDAAWAILVEPLDPRDAAKFKKEEEQKLAANAVAGEPQIRRINIVRKGALRRDIRTYTDNSTLECWWTDQNGLVALQDKPGGRIVVMKSGNLQRDRYDITLFNWIGPATYKRDEIFRDRPCRRYEIVVLQKNTEKITLLAWIDTETNRPAGWSDGGNATLFTFDSEPVPDALTIPAPYQRELDRIKAFYAPPPPPPPNRPRSTQAPS